MGHYASELITDEEFEREKKKRFDHFATKNALIAMVDELETVDATGKSLLKKLFIKKVLKGSYEE